MGVQRQVVEYEVQPNLLTHEDDHFARLDCGHREKLACAPSEGSPYLPLRGRVMDCSTCQAASDGR